MSTYITIVGECEHSPQVKPIDIFKFKYFGKYYNI